MSTYMYMYHICTHMHNNISQPHGITNYINKCSSTVHTLISSTYL